MLHIWLKYNPWGNAVLGIISKFLLCPLRGFMPIWLNRFIYATNTARGMMMCSIPFPGQGLCHTNSGKFLPCLSRFLPKLLHMRCNYEVMWTQCDTHNSKVKRWKVKITWLMWNFCGVCLMALCLSNRITSYVTQKQSMRRRCVTHHFQVKRSMVKVTWYFKVLLCPVHGSVTIRSIYFTNTTHGDMMCHAPFPGQRWKVKVA